MSDENGAIDAAVVPALAACDVKQLSLGRLEAFVLAQVDGVSSVEDLASLAGIELSELRRVLVRLHDAGAIVVPGRARPRKSKAPGRKSTRSMRRVSTSTKAVPAKLSPDCIPRRAGKSQSSLSIDMKDAFVLAQVDGSTAVSDLAAIAGLEVDALSAILGRLIQAGAVELSDGKKRRTSRPPIAQRGTPIAVDVFTTRAQRRRATRHPPPPSVRASVSEVPPSGRGRASKAPPPSSRRAPTSKAPPASKRPQPSKAPPSRRSKAPPSRTITDSALEGPCELDDKTRARIDELHAILPSGTHYDVLGISRDADRKAIKSAYFGFVAALHPDRHFKKRLGTWKQKLEDVFVRTTLAFETLDRASSRADYDRSLGTPPLLMPPHALVPNIAISAREEASHEPPPSLVPSRARIRVSLDRHAASSGPVSVPHLAPQRPPPSEAPKKRDRAAGADPLESLKRFFDDKVEQEGRKRARVFAEAGEYELGKGNFIAAATQFQFALNCCNAPEIRQALEAVEGKALARKSEIHLADAAAAERDHRWPDAASAYAKAHAARPTPSVAERLANAIRQTAGDLRQAAKLAEEAVKQEPENAAFRVTLGEVYADAGLEVRAEAEASRAIKLAPADPRAKALLATLGKKRR